MCHVRLSGIVRCGVSWSGYPRERLPVTVSSIHVITIRSKPTSLPANSTLCTYLPSPKLRGTLFLQPPLHLHDVVGVGRCIKEPPPLQLRSLSWMPAAVLHVRLHYHLPGPPRPWCPRSSPQPPPRSLPPDSILFFDQFSQIPACSPPPPPPL